MGVLWTVHIDNNCEKEREERAVYSGAATTDQRYPTVKEESKGSVTLWRSTIIPSYSLFSSGHIMDYGCRE